MSKIYWAAYLKRKASRLRDWNQWQTDHKEDSEEQTWKEKHLDYEIETPDMIPAVRKLLKPWKEKHLDYEIETRISPNHALQTVQPLKRKASRLRDWNLPWSCWSAMARLLEKKSISITRLKLGRIPWEFRFYRRSWKEKHLDYEIETKTKAKNIRGGLFHLKRKASRLRDWNKFALPPTGITLTAWKEKHLDYEIETVRRHKALKVRILSWKEKHLDYEIETAPAPWTLRFYRIPWKEKHLDYEIETVSNTSGSPSLSFHLKRKASRLRDWN